MSDNRRKFSDRQISVAAGMIGIPDISTRSPKIVIWCDKILAEAISRNLQADDMKAQSEQIKLAMTVLAVPSVDSFAHDAYSAAEDRILGLFCMLDECDQKVEAKSCKPQNAPTTENK